MLREEDWTIVDGLLLHRVQPKRGRPYEHTCLLDTYEAMAHEIDLRGEESFTCEEIREKVDAPHSQASVAWSFMIEMGVIVRTLRRRHIRATADVYLDAMIEWHALAEKKKSAA